MKYIIKKFSIRENPLNPRHPRSINYILYFAVAAVLAFFTTGCSRGRETRTYDELETAGEVESTARKDYREFFKAVKSLGDIEENQAESVPDSVLMKEAMILTDGLIGDMRPFPSTVKSRISLDALSYAAFDLTESPGFSNVEVVDFWRNGLLDPIFTKGWEYIKSGKTNESTIFQLVKALQRGMSTKATDDMLINVISVVGPAPSERIMELCRNDSLVFKKVYDLIVYSRSLQEMGPPLWMMTGPWLLAVGIEDEPLSFYCLNPLNLNNSLYLTFRDYSLGEVYAAVFDDPVPENSSQMDDWLTRAGTAMDSLKFNDAFAEKVLHCGLPVYDTHNYYNDYILAAKADTVRKEFRVILKRERVEESSFQFAGVDSIEVLFTQKEIMSRADTITPLAASRYRGESMFGGRFIPAGRGSGMAFLLPMGTHDENIIRELRESMLPEIIVNAQ